MDACSQNAHYSISPDEVPVCCDLATGEATATFARAFTELIATLYPDLKDAQSVGPELHRLVRAMLPEAVAAEAARDESETAKTLLQALRAPHQSARQYRPHIALDSKSVKVLCPDEQLRQSDEERQYSLYVANQTRVLYFGDPSAGNNVVVPLLRATFRLRLPEGWSAAGRVVHLLLRRMDETSVAVEVERADGAVATTTGEQEELFEDLDPAALDAVFGKASVEKIERQLFDLKHQPLPPCRSNVPPALHRAWLDLNGFLARLHVPCTASFLATKHDSLRPLVLDSLVVEKAPAGGIRVTSAVNPASCKSLDGLDTQLRPERMSRRLDVGDSRTFIEMSLCGRCLEMRTDDRGLSCYECPIHGRGFDRKCLENGHKVCASQAHWRVYTTYGVGHRFGAPLSNFGESQSREPIVIVGRARQKPRETLARTDPWGRLLNNPDVGHMMALFMATLVNVCYHVDTEVTERSVEGVPPTPTDEPDERAAPDEEQHCARVVEHYLDRQRQVIEDMILRIQGGFDGRKTVMTKMPIKKNVFAVADATAARLLEEGSHCSGVKRVVNQQPECVIYSLNKRKRDSGSRGVGVKQCVAMHAHLFPPHHSDWSTCPTDMQGSALANADYEARVQRNAAQPQRGGRTRVHDGDSDDEY
jgi:hypothetical protein